VPALAVTILFLTSLGGWGAAQASPLVPVLFDNPSSSALPVAPARWRHRYWSRSDDGGEDNRPNVFWKRSDESYGSDSLVRPFMPIVPPDRRRRGRWVDPPPLQ
jgi:hypothetical protein